LAFRILSSANGGSVRSEPSLDDVFLQHPDLEARDRAFTVNLVQGVYRWRQRLDWMIEQSLQFPFADIEPPILHILRIALYQIFFMDRVPQSAAVNEAVRQAKGVSRPHVSGFVNGILRKICRRKGQMTFPDRERDPVRFLSVFYSYPTWLVELWIQELGFNGAEQLMEAQNRIPAMEVRTNTLKIDPFGLLERLTLEGVTAEPGLFVPEALRIRKLGRPIRDLRSFQEGLFQVQSEAAQVCTHVLSPRPGEAVLEVCAGVGGKTTHAAQFMANQGRLVALDIRHSRLVKLLRSAHRLGCRSILPVAADGSHGTGNLFHLSFEKILVDAPCSGLGVIARHPDIKWAREESDTVRLGLLQEQMLQEAIPLLRTGGRLLYITCTVSREENENVVAHVLRQNKELVREDLQDSVPPWAKQLVDEQGYFRTLPHVHGIDGLFGARFAKAAS
jgi:16S rRNA (cytosine967-C5)-methyltransferase